MNTVFIGGSRHVSNLSAEVKERLNNIWTGGHRVILGDADGVDRAVQAHLLEMSYRDVTVFCSGETCRNNLGRWPTRFVSPPKGAKGFQFYAAKDREMACQADFGLMIWDGKSVGTSLNVLRLVLAGKIAVLMELRGNQTINFRSPAQWQAFLSRCGQKLRDEMSQRATREERAAMGAASPVSLLEFAEPTPLDLHVIT